MTIYGARLTPSVGLQVRQNANVRHKLMLGIDMMKDFGRHPSAVATSPEHDRGLENTRLFREITMYYGIDAKLGSWKLQAFAGMFPRAFSEGEYSQAFFSDSLKFYDNNLEGALIKASNSRAYMEVAFDWNGMFGSYRGSSSMLSDMGVTCSATCFQPAWLSNIIISPIRKNMAASWMTPWFSRL